jgi:CheY-like chemotaxis protein
MNDDLAAGRYAEILLVEDNLDDVELTREGFKRSMLAVHLHHVENGEDCLSFLRKAGRFADAPTPDLILLDLNMPVMSGYEVMRHISDDPALNHFPVIVLTSSADESDVLTMYKLRCSSYIVKPVDFTKFAHAVADIGRYWFTVVVLPK